MKNILDIQINFKNKYIKNVFDSNNLFFGNGYEADGDSQLETMGLEVRGRFNADSILFK